MKRHFYLTLIGLTLVLLAFLSSASAIDSKEQANRDCKRGQAEPIIQKEDYPNTTFLLQADSISALETIVFENGDKLIIKNWGCEYYVLTFRFETTKFQGDTTNLAYWFRSSAILITGMLSALDAPIDIKRGLVFLHSYIAKHEDNKTLKLGEEIDFDGSTIRNFLTIDRIEKLNDIKYAVTLSYTTGPL